MTTITLIDVKTKKEYDKLFKQMEKEWIKRIERTRKILKRGY